MLARRSILTHAGIGEIELPLLVPAFSSKGFGFESFGRGRKKRDYSEIAYELADFGRRPSSSILVSGYDLHFGHFDAPELPAKRPETHLRNTRLVFLDSGGYELVDDFDSTEIKTYLYTPKEGYGRREYEDVLKRLTALKEPMPLVITNFDSEAKGKALDIQINEARSLFHKFPTCISDFILKPWSRNGKEVNPANMSDTDFTNLRGFDIIGVTEKELGKNIIDRIEKICMLRQRLDRGKVTSPIHVWGGLDPILTPLYFFAGAEIFDGISWLRYAFRNGMAMHRESYAVVSEIGVTASRHLTHAYASLDNLTFLDNLTIALQQWVDFEGQRFDMFHLHVRESLEKAYKIMVSKLASLKGGR
jgi:hypothetical protein